MRTTNCTADVKAATVYAVATSEAGTRVAMRTAQQIGASDDASVVVLVPHVVPYGTELDRCGHDLMRLAEPLQALAAGGKVDATIRVCACREAGQVLRLLQIDRAQIVVAGRRGRWRPTRDERLARALELEGHHVVFVDLNGAHADSNGRAPRSGSSDPRWANHGRFGEYSAPVKGVQGLFRHLLA